MDEDKGLKKLMSKPLVYYVIERISKIVDEIILVVGSFEQLQAYHSVLGDDVVMLQDEYLDGSPLVGAITGFKNAKGKYALITGCDMPFISIEAAQLLFSEAGGFNGAVFQWPNGWIEPLFAVYEIKPSLDIAQDLYNSGNLRLRFVLKKLPEVKFIPIETLKKIDPQLLTLFDVDTEDAFREAEEILKCR